MNEKQIDLKEGKQFFRRLIIFAMFWAAFVTIALAGFIYLLVHLFGHAGYLAVALSVFVMVWSVSFDRMREMERNIRKREQV